MEMVDVVLNGMAKHCEEGTIQTWYFEEGDAVSEGDELIEVMTEEGTITIVAPAAGILAEVYYDEGDVVEKGEVLCSIDVDDSDDDDEDSDDEEEEEEDEE